MTPLQGPIEIATDTGARLDALGVALLDRHVTPFAKAIGRDYYVDVDAMRHAVTSGESFNAVHFARAIKVDFFVAGDDPFEAERLQSRQSIELPNGVLHVDTAEHTLAEARVVPARR